MWVRRAKKISGRKRHRLVDTLGLVLRTNVHAATLHDRAAVPLLREATLPVFPTIEHVWVEQGYTGSGNTWITTHLGWAVTLVQHPPVIRHTRTFAWLGQNRRLSNDDERLCDTSETLIYASMSRLMMRRLARS